MAEDEELLDDDEYFRMIMYLPEKVSKCVALIAESYLKDTNLKVYHMPYILNIKNQDGISQKQLKETIPFDKSRISVVINELIKGGLVYNDGTGRNSSLHLTDAGQNASTIFKMLFDIIRKEVFLVKDDEEKEIRRRNIQMNSHFDAILAKYNKQ